MNIIMCGLPGCGKTTVGKVLAEKLTGTFIDTDELIEKAYEKETGEALGCRQIFSSMGEAYFRELENGVIVSLAEDQLENTVISIGGGALKFKKNRELLKEIGTLVYIKNDINELYQRITKGGYPAYLDTEDPFGSFEQIVEERSPLYSEATDITLEGNGRTPEEIAEMILNNVPRRLDISIPSKSAGYPVLVGEKLLESHLFIDLLSSAGASLLIIITDTTVESLHAKKLADFLLERGLNVHLISFPEGEEHKTRATKERCENEMLALGAGRDTCVIAIGGGVVTDVAGYAASTYCRGVPAIMIPTTLLAMVDASVGGKTGVNVPEGKNLIGTFSQPRAVFIDCDTLKTLPLTEIKNGIAEMIKHGLIASKQYYTFMKNNAVKLLELDRPLMEKAIYESIVIKANIVEQDEKEGGIRRLLNLGHTVAHAIESATKHAIPHGKAVSIGVVTESYLSMQMGHLQRSEFENICEIYEVYDIDLTWENSLSPDRLFDLMQMDKKSLQKTPRFVILREIGKPLDFNGQYCTAVDETLLMKTLEWMCSNVMRRH